MGIFKIQKLQWKAYKGLYKMCVTGGVHVPTFRCTAAFHKLFFNIFRDDKKKFVYFDSYLKIKIGNFNIRKLQWKANKILDKISTTGRVHVLTLSLYSQKPFWKHFWLEKKKCLFWLITQKPIEIFKIRKLQWKANTILYKISTRAGVHVLTVSLYSPVTSRHCTSHSRLLRQLVLETFLLQHK